MLLTIPELLAQAIPNVRQISAQQAADQRRVSDSILIDVREPSEAQESPVAGAINIPRGVIEMKMPELCPSPTQLIYVHCATGARAALAAEQLSRLGYQNVSAISCALGAIHQSDLHCSQA